MNISTCVRSALDILTRIFDTTQPTTETKLTTTKTASCAKCGKVVTPENFLAEQDGCATKRCQLRRFKVEAKIFEQWGVEDREELVQVEHGEIEIRKETTTTGGYNVYDLQDLSDEEAQYWRMMGARDRGRYGFPIF